MEADRRVSALAMSENFRQHGFVQVTDHFFDIASGLWTSLEAK